MKNSDFFSVRPLLFVSFLITVFYVAILITVFCVAIPFPVVEQGKGRLFTKNNILYCVKTCKFLAYSDFLANFAPGNRYANRFAHQ